MAADAYPMLGSVCFCHLQFVFYSVTAALLTEAHPSGN